jgi:tRNA nucleotidyltransferase (CCA-adding enzyme)
MSRKHIDHSDILIFAEERVNLPAEKASIYREQARGLREKLNNYIVQHPDFSLRKMLLSGSLAKGTALRSINDIDIACYISGADAPIDRVKLIDYLTTRLRSAYPNVKSEQINPQTYSVTISFQGTGLDIDVVPILYDGDPEWYGNLVSQEDGSLLKTNIGYHLEFIRKRKNASSDFAQIVRLVKFWARKIKNEQDGFRFKSFMIEMILSHLVDKGLSLKDYPEALQHFFTYIAKTGLKEQIFFSDYYEPDKVKSFQEPVKIIDPVNADNNVARLYTKKQADLIITAALDAGDAIDSAMAATTKEDTVYYWRKVFGTSFN